MNRNILLCFLTIFSGCFIPIDAHSYGVFKVPQGKIVQSHEWYFYAYADERTIRGDAWKDRYEISVWIETKKWYGLDGELIDYFDRVRDKSSYKARITKLEFKVGEDTVERSAPNRDFENWDSESGEATYHTLVEPDIWAEKGYTAGYFIPDTVQSVIVTIFADFLNTETGEIISRQVSYTLFRDDGTRIETLFPAGF